LLEQVEGPPEEPVVQQGNKVEQLLETALLEEIVVQHEKAEQLLKMLLPRNLEFNKARLKSWLKADSNSSRSGSPTATV
jgi:hypothetical protein